VPYSGSFFNLRYQYDKLFPDFERINEEEDDPNESKNGGPAK